MTREFKHPLRQYECDECSQPYQVETAMGEPAVFSFQRFCASCNKSTQFDLIYGSTYMTAGMYTRRYTGQEAAVQGWGTHNLDYGKAGSDLVSGRATEAAKRNPPKVAER